MRIRTFPLGGLWANCYLVWDSGGRAFAVDPGGDPAEVIEYIDRNGLTLEWILLTHGHGDHIGGLEDIRGLAQNGVAIASADADCLTDAKHNLSGAMGSPFRFSGAERLLNDGDMVPVGQMEVRMIATPGHTVGSACYLARDPLPDDGFGVALFSGDTLFARSIGRSDLPGGDEDELIDSLRTLSKLDDAIPVFPGHGPATSIGQERQLNPYWPR